MDDHQNPQLNQPTNSSIPPNRKNFEQRIWQINNKLAKLQEQMRSYWKEEKRTKFGELKEKLDNAKREYGLEAEEELKLMEGLRELEGKVQGKQREVHEMEECADLIYKSMPMAKQKLAQLEGQFKERKFTNIRDEQMWVAQMDKMQRNIGRLAKYLPLVEQKRMLEMELREKRRRVREVRQKMRMHKDEAGECRRQIGGMQQPFRRLRETLSELRAEKRELVERYNAQMDEYRKWAREERTRKAQIGGGSFPSASLLQQDSDSMDLFHCQKTACTRLISYLNGLKEFGESRVEAKEKEREIKFELHKKEGEEDSGEELPEAFQKHFNLGDGQKGRNKLEEDVRKLAKKQAMPLSHGIDWIRLFGEIEVPPPRTHADVPGVLREVQRVFEFYKSQTAEQEEEEDEVNGGCPDWAMMGLSGYSSTLTSPTGISSSLLSPASFASYSPRLSFAHQQNKANKEEPEIWTEDEPCSSSAESSIGKTSGK